MIIKKFKNGNLTMKLEKGYDFDDYKILEKVYYDDMFLCGLYIEFDDDMNAYIVDTNKELAYPLCNNTSNPLIFLINALEIMHDKRQMFRLYPVHNDTIYNRLMNGGFQE